MFPASLLWRAPARRRPAGSRRLHPALASALVLVSTALAQPASWATKTAADPIALTLLADRLELAGDAQALALRHAAVAAAPTAIELRLALVHTAARLGDLPAAQRSLESLGRFTVPADARRLAVTAVDWASGFPPVTPAPVDALADAASLARVLLDLRFARPPAAADLRRRLSIFLATRPADDELRRALVRDARRNHDEPRALALAQAPDAWTGSGLRGRLFAADVALTTQPGLTPDETTRAPFATLAARDPVAAADFVAWLLAHDQAAVALAWLDTLPAEMHDAPSLRTAAATLHAALGDWAHAVPLIAAGAWGTAAPTVIDQAATLRPRSPDPTRAEAWSALLRAAGPDAATLGVLHRLALCWDFTTEDELTLNALTVAAPAERGWFQLLASQLREERATARLAALYARWHDAQPDNLAVDAERLLLTVLVAGKPTPGLRATIDERLMFAPEQPSLQLARALALWAVGRRDEARAVTDALPPVERHRVMHAFYHGLFVATSSEPGGDASDYLQLADRAGLLPEEAALVQLAQAALKGGK